MDSLELTKYNVAAPCDSKGVFNLNDGKLQRLHKELTRERKDRLKQSIEIKA